MDYNEIVETLKSIKTRPALYIRKYPYFDIAISFIDGYLTAWAYSYNLEQKNQGHSLWKDIQEWYCGELNENHIESVPEIVKMRHINLNDEELIQKYIDILVEFFKYKKNEKQ